MVTECEGVSGVAAAEIDGGIFSQLKIDIVECPLLSAPIAQTLSPGFTEIGFT
ncbi:hypothetical protein D3C81_1072340 [compost metagenome]